MNLYDYNARFYDPAVGRFTSQDPLNTKYASWSPYAYVLNSPLNYTDPSGMSPKDRVGWALAFSGMSLGNASFGGNALHYNFGVSNSAAWASSGHSGGFSHPSAVGGGNSSSSSSPDWYPEYDEETGRINLVAEEGDNERSFRIWANGIFSSNEATSLYSSMKNGRVDLSNTHIGKFLNGFAADRTKGCSFNCFSSVVNGLSGLNSKKWKFLGEENFNQFIIQNNYQTNSFPFIPVDKIQPFNTILGYSLKQADINGIMVPIGGLDKSGVPWVLTKASDSNLDKYIFQKGIIHEKLENYFFPDKIYTKK